MLPPDKRHVTSLLCDVRRNGDLFDDIILTFRSSPPDENITDASSQIGQALVGHSSQVGASLCRRHTAPPAVQPDALLRFLQHVVHVQTHPDRKTSHSLNKTLPICTQSATLFDSSYPLMLL